MILILHKSFEKQYLKADALVRRRFQERRNLFLANPTHPLLNLHPLKGDRDGQWSINITGDWRAVFIYKNINTVIFIDLNMHAQLYK